MSSTGAPELFTCLAVWAAAAPIGVSATLAWSTSPYVLDEPRYEIVDLPPPRAGAAGGVGSNVTQP